MPKCPICDGELKEGEGDSWICESCGETIPSEHVKECKLPCCDPLRRCR